MGRYFQLILVPSVRALDAGIDLNSPDHTVTPSASDPRCRSRVHRAALRLERSLPCRLPCCAELPAPSSSALMLLDPLLLESNSLAAVIVCWGSVCLHLCILSEAVPMSLD